MAIEKVYPQLRCSACGGELESTEPETEYVFVLSVKPCKRCAAQQSVQLTVLPVREIETVCPHCSLVFDVPVPEPHSN